MIGRREVIYSSIRMTVGYSSFSFGLFSVEIVTIVAYDKIADVDAHTTDVSSSRLDTQTGGFTKRMTAAKGRMGVREYPSSAM